jgi:hypothetical protein
LHAKRVDFQTLIPRWMSPSSGASFGLVHAPTEATGRGDLCLLPLARAGPSIVTRFGVEVTNHVPGTPTQIEVRGRYGSTSHLWMGRAPNTAGVQEGTSRNHR